MNERPLRQSFSSIFFRQLAEGIEEAGYGASVHKMDEQGEVELGDPEIKAAKVCDTLAAFRGGAVLYYTEYNTGGDEKLGLYRERRYTRRLRVMCFESRKFIIRE